jgi:hypothetical protein
VLDGLAKSNDGGNETIEKMVGQKAKALCARFPIYR